MTELVARDDLKAAVDVLRNGGVIVMPTDTLYALSAAAGDAPAIGRIYASKVREQGKALPLLVAGIEMAGTVAQLDAQATRLAERFWPGQLTIVVPKREDFHSAALAGLDTVALRQPDNAVAQAVITAVGQPVTGTSANRSGGSDPSTVEEARRQLGAEVDLFIDGGECPVGVSSTIVDCTSADVRILREGAISARTVEEVLRA